MDFAALPPEINSARMYLGAGAAPLLAAAASWANLSADLAETAGGIRSTVTALAAVWMGPSAQAATAAIGAYVAWLESTATQAQQTSAAASTAADAYAQAFAATVPPPLIAANRAQLVTLTVTNFLGVNTAAIAATEAAYAEMWAQDAAAMYAYQAASSATVSALPKFSPAPKVAAPTEPPLLQWLLGGQTVPQLFWNLTSAFISSGPYNVPIEMLALFTSLVGMGSASQAITNRITPSNTVIIPPQFTPRITGGSIGARMGAAERLGGRLSVPPNWTQAREPSAARSLPNTEQPVATPLEPGKKPLPIPLPLPIPVGGTPTRQPRPVPEYGTRSTVVPRHPLGG